MTFKIKELVNDKFWIVESNAGKVGTIRRVDAGYEFFDQRNNATQLLSNIDNFTQLEHVTESDIAYKTIDSYPTNSSIAIHVQHETLPVFRKKETSKSVYAAGYYIIKFKYWLPSFCPKLDTLEKYEYRGPFLTEWDMNLSLRKAKKDD
jgi:hypothetical protein